MMRWAWAMALMAALQGLRVEALAHFHQGVQGGVEDLRRLEVPPPSRPRGWRTGGAGAGQALRQFSLIPKPLQPMARAEAHDGRLADADFGQVGHGTVHHRGRVLQDVIGDLQ